MKFQGFCIICGRSNKVGNVPLSLLNIIWKSEACNTLQSAVQTSTSIGRRQPEKQNKNTSGTVTHNSATFKKAFAAQILVSQAAVRSQPAAMSWSEPQVNFQIQGFKARKLHSKVLPSTLRNKNRPERGRRKNKEHLFSTENCFPYWQWQLSTTLYPQFQ